MAFHNEQTRELAAHLCGRGLYEDMLPWETRTGEFAQLWQAVPKVVFSTTLEAVEGNATWPPCQWPRRWPDFKMGRTATSPSAAPVSPPH
jgi:hypothetical protein